MSDNYYSILGVQETANATEIKVRYRFLSQAYHPDKFASDAHRQIAEYEFKRINEAYQVLSNPIQRARFDASRTRSAPPPKHESQPSSEYEPPRSQPSHSATTRPAYQTEQPIPSSWTKTYFGKSSDPAPTHRRGSFLSVFFLFWILITIATGSSHNDIVSAVIVGAVLSVPVSIFVSFVIDRIAKQART